MRVVFLESLIENYREEEYALFTVNWQKLKNLIGARSDIGAKFINEELNQGRNKKVNGERLRRVHF